MAIVILGAGIIGTSTAYYLSQSSDTPPTDIHLVESSTELFASASGYAAGFLACDWFSPASSALGALSFDLHRELAEKDNGFEKWGYSRSTATSLAETVDDGEEDWLGQGATRAKAAKRIADNDESTPVWLDPKHGRPEIISRGETTAQVDPRLLCQHLLAACLARGIHLHQPYHPTHLSPPSTPSSPPTLHLSPHPSSTAPPLSIPVSRLLLSAGAWTPSVFRTLFPSSPITLPIGSLAGYSLVLRSPHWPLPPPPSNSNSTSSASPSTHALFTVSTNPPYSPELFSRFPDAAIYIAGLNAPGLPLPRDPVESAQAVDEGRVAVLRATARGLLGEDAVDVRAGLCFRPTGGPVVGEVREEMGGMRVWVASGHGPWGISLSLGTGKVMAEMMEGKETSADVRGLALR